MIHRAPSGKNLNDFTGTGDKNPNNAFSKPDKDILDSFGNNNLSSLSNYTNNNNNMNNNNNNINNGKYNFGQPPSNLHSIGNPSSNVNIPNSLNNNN